MHPASWILCWCLLLAALQGMVLQWLLLLAVLLLSLSLALARHKFGALLRRTRWVLLSLLLIYGYATPGQALIETWGVFSPSYEGLADGALQLLRLLLALASLALLLDKLHRQQLVAGLYSLLWPLSKLGWSRERLAVRLALTLHYAEVAMLRRSEFWFADLQHLFEVPAQVDKTLVLPVYEFGWRDGVMVLLALLLLGWVYS